MADLKSRWLSLIARYSTEAPDTTIADISTSPAQSEAPIDSVSETIEINSVEHSRSSVAKKIGDTRHGASPLVQADLRLCFELPLELPRPRGRGSPKKFFEPPQTTAPPLYLCKNARNGETVKAQQDAIF